MYTNFSAGIEVSAEVLAAVEYDGRSLAFASESLRDDLEVVSAAVAQDASCLPYASANMRALATLAEVAVSTR